MQAKVVEERARQRHDKCSKLEPSEIRINKGFLSVIFLSLRTNTNYTNPYHSIKCLAARM